MSSWMQRLEREGETRAKVTSVTRHVQDVDRSWWHDVVLYHPGHFDGTCWIPEVSFKRLGGEDNGDETGTVIDGQVEVELDEVELDGVVVRAWRCENLPVG